MAADAPRPEKSRRALLWTSTTYFGEGLPWSFLHQMVTEFMTALGRSSTQVTATSALHTAVGLKFLWSPVLDLFGRRRTWVWGLQLLLGGGMFVVAALAPSKNMVAIWTAVSLLAIVHATHDIACDGFYLQALDRHGQALYSGTRLGAYRLALIVGSSALVYVAGKTSWLLGFGAAGVVMLVTALVNAVVMPKPPEGHGDPPGTPTGAHKAPAFLEAFRSFVIQPQAVRVLAFLVTYRLGDILMFNISKPLLRDLGIGTAQRGVLNGLGTGASIVGVILGGALVARRGLARTLVPLIYMQNLAIPLYLGMAVFKPGYAGVTAVVFVEQFAAGLGLAASNVFIMQRCRRAFSASHFAMATSLVAWVAVGAGLISGPIDDWLGHRLFFTLAFVASIPSLILVWFVPTDPIEAETA